ncbi:MAG: RNase P/RNase MRP subunit p30 [Patescibacteria group bacterium]|jgi:RNase P/RNase MRP subunit p30
MANDLNYVTVKGSLLCKSVADKGEANFDSGVDCFIVDCAGNEKKTRVVVDSFRSKKVKVGVIAYDNVFNRRVLETMKIDFLIGVEFDSKRDGIKQRDSGLNHVVGRIARDKGVGILLDLNRLRKLDGVMLAKVLARVMQNLDVARRAGCMYAAVSLGNVQDDVVVLRERKDFLQGLGASSLQVKQFKV